MKDYVLLLAGCLLVGFPHQIAAAAPAALMASIGDATPIDVPLDLSVTPRRAMLERAMQLMDGADRSPTMGADGHGPAHRSPEPLPETPLSPGVIDFGHDVRHPISASPVDILTTDLNGDGRTDIVVSTENGFSVLMGGIAGIQAPVDSPFDERIANAAMADLDGDGTPEMLATTYFAAHLVVLSWNGDGFREDATYPVGAYPYGVVAFDADGDSDLDVAVGSGQDNKVTVFENDGAGLLTPSGTLVIGPEPAEYYGTTDVVAADMNGDGVPDLVALQADDRNLAMFAGRGDMTFEPPIISSTGPRAYDLVVSDIDADGDLDLAFAQRFLTLLKNDGHGAFTRYTNYEHPIGWGLNAGAIDLDHDGHDELVMTCSVAGGYELGRIVIVGGPVATEVVTARSYLVDRLPLDVAFGDFNGDGLPDVVMANAARNFQGPGSISIAYNRGQSALASASELFIPGAGQLGGSPGRHVVGLGVITIAGLESLVFGQNDSTFVMRNDGRGWFTEPEFLTEGVPAEVVDLDGDANDDLITRDMPDVDVIKLGDGSGHFRATDQVPAGALLGDVDGDGHKDLVFGFSSGYLEYRANLGDGRFAAPREVGFVESSPRSAYRLFAELDGKPGDELALALNGPQRDDTLEIWSKDRSHRFGRPARAIGPTIDVPHYSLDEKPLQLASADFDRDGRADIAVLGGTFLSLGYVSVFLNRRRDGWACMPPVGSGAESAEMAIADFDLDGLPDVAVANRYSEYPSYALIHRGLGDGRLEYVGRYYPGDYPVEIVSADFDGDRRPDLALNCHRRGTIGVLMNNSTTAVLRHVAATVEAATEVSGAVHVEWSLPAVINLHVERATDGGHWQRAGSAAMLPSGHMAYDDSQVDPGRRYGYRLVADDDRIQIDGSEAWVKLMPHGGIRLHEMARVGSAGSSIALTVEADRAQVGAVSLFDVCGRGLAMLREVSLRVGSQSVNLPAGADLPQGIYWVRFRGPEASVVSRVVLVR